MFIRESLSFLRSNASLGLQGKIYRYMDLLLKTQFRKVDPAQLVSVLAGYISDVPTRRVGYQNQKQGKEAIS